MREIEGYLTNIKSLLDELEEKYKSDVIAFCEKISKKIEEAFDKKKLNF